MAFSVITPPATVSDDSVPSSHLLVLPMHDSSMEPQANSKDTGGMVGADWATIRWEKPAYLATVGLAPYWAAASTLDPLSPGKLAPPAGPNLAPPAAQRNASNEAAGHQRHAVKRNASVAV